MIVASESNQPQYAHKKQGLQPAEVFFIWLHTLEQGKND